VSRFGVNREPACDRRTMERNGLLIPLLDLVSLALYPPRRTRLIKLSSRDCDGSIDGSIWDALGEYVIAHCGRMRGTSLESRRRSRAAEGNESESRPARLFNRASNTPRRENSSLPSMPEECGATWNATAATSTIRCRFSRPPSPAWDCRRCGEKESRDRTPHGVLEAIRKSEEERGRDDLCAPFAHRMEIVWCFMQTRV